MQNTIAPPYFQRPNSPKTMLAHNSSAKNLSLTLSMGPNQAPQFMPMQKFKPNEQRQSQPVPDRQQTTLQKLQQELKLSSKETFALREENSQLRRELLKLRRQPTFENPRSLEKFSLSPDFSDLRGTIKKEMNEIKDLRAKVQSLTNQCKMYQEIIGKMQERINKLLHQNDKKKLEIEEYQLQLGKMDHLKEKTNTVVRLLSDLESKFNMEQLQWMRWKQSWLSEKQAYLQRIRELERLTTRHYH